MYKIDLLKLIYVIFIFNYINIIVFNGSCLLCRGYKVEKKINFFFCKFIIFLGRNLSDVVCCIFYLVKIIIMKYFVFLYLVKFRL